MTTPPPSFITHFRFTKSKLKEALDQFLEQGDQNQIVCWDKDCIGLIAVLYRASKRINFRARPYVDGSRLNRGLGDLGDISVEQARLACHAIRVDGAYDGDAHTNRMRTLTFSDLVTKRYFPQTSKIKRSHDDDAQKFKLRLEPAFGAKRLNAITSVEIQKFLDSLQEIDNLSPATVNRYRALLHAIFKFAVGDRLLKQSPMANIKALPENNIRKTALSEEECRTFLAECRTEENTLAGALFEIMLLTAARLGEALGARIEDVDLKHRRWRLPMTKKGKEDYIQLSDKTASVFARVIEGRKSGFVFPGKDHTKPMSRPAKAFERICKRAGISGLIPHDLRRTVAVLLINRGTPMEVVSKLLRHSSVGVTATRYAHLQDATLMKSIDLFAQMIN